jgi:hypothetical protein
MLVTDREELRVLEYALEAQARRHREYAETQPPLRGNSFRYRAEILERMRMRLLEEHYPAAAESEKARLHR